MIRCLGSGQNDALPGRRTGRARENGWRKKWEGAAPINTAQNPSLGEKHSCCAFRHRKSNEALGRELALRSGLRGHPTKARSLNPANSAASNTAVFALAGMSMRRELRQVGSRPSGHALAGSRPSNDPTSELGGSIIWFSASGFSGGEVKVTPIK